MTLQEIIIEVESLRKQLDELRTVVAQHEEYISIRKSKKSKTH